jgi:hypothetical protein
MDAQTKPSVFGRSLQLDGGDLAFADGDLALVSGRDNLLQALQVMIETPFGADIFNVNYGFDALGALGQPQSVRMTRDLVRLQIVKSLDLDDRVREIKEVVFDDDPRFFEIDPQAGALEESRLEHKSSRRWRAMIVISTVPEGNVAGNLAGNVAVRLEGTEI